MVLFKFFFIALPLLFLVSCKKLPNGASMKSTLHRADRVNFIYDLTYEKDGVVVHEQNIFDNMLKIIDEAEEFIIVDFFLYNSDYSREYSYPKLSEKLTSALIKKKSRSGIPIYVISDEVNTFYGSYYSNEFERLRENGIEVIITDLSKLPDSNPTYSIIWKPIFSWFGTEGIGWLPNPFSPDSPRVTLRSYLKLLNFKANHRKVIISEKKVMVSSSNPHDASAYHSNIAFEASGPIINEAVYSEKAVAEFSSSSIEIEEKEYTKENGEIQISLITEGKIGGQLSSEIQKTGIGDSIKIGVFYLSDRDVINDLIDASKRGTEVSIVLDLNKDAFGRKKNGIPNRVVAKELLKKSNNKIQLKWYKTNGEQFHSKMAILNFPEETVVIGGSANFTKRNIRDYNLEANFKIVAPQNSKFSLDVNHYFDRIWQNNGGLYTLEYSEGPQEISFKYFLYRFQEWSGFSTY